MDIRETVRAYLDEFEMTAASVADDPRCSAHRQTLYRWLRGELALTDRRLSEVLNVMGLVIVPAEEAKAWRRGKAMRRKR